METSPMLDLTKISPNLFATFNQSHTNSTIKDLHMVFFSAKNNTAIKNVAFFINATKDDKVLIHELFYTHTGYFTIKFQPDNKSKGYTVSGDVEPTLGGLTSQNDTVTISTGSFMTHGIYHIRFDILALIDPHDIIDQTKPLQFDAWWSIDNNGNISRYGNNSTISENNTASLQIGNPWVLGLPSPLKQFKSGTKAQDVKCQPSYFTLVIKTEDGSPKCVKQNTANILVERGWAKFP